MLHYITQTPKDCCPYFFRIHSCHHFFHMPGNTCQSTTMTHFANCNFAVLQEFSLTHQKVRCTTDDDCDAGTFCDEANTCVSVNNKTLAFCSESLKIIISIRKFLHFFHQGECKSDKHCVVLHQGVNAHWLCIANQCIQERAQKHF